MQTAEFSKLKEMSSTMLESLRALRTNIQFCGDDVKTILFTSTIPDEGKSTVVLDLARSIGESGKKVLIVDTDMRKSVIMSEYGVTVSGNKHDQIFGLSHYLSGQRGLEDVVYGTNLKRVDIVFAGRSIPNPTEINISRFFTTILFFTKAGLNMPVIFKDLALYGEKPELEKKINPLPDGLMWLRAMDREPMLATHEELESLISHVG